MYRVSLLAVLLVSSACASPPEPIPPGTTLELGQPITVPVGKKCILTAETTAKKVTWITPPGADAMPLDGRRLAVWATPGTYTFTAMVPSGDDVISKEIVLTVTGAIPPPIPIPVPVVDPLIALAQLAYTSDPSPTKAADKVGLSTVFTILADAANAPEIKTAKNLFDVVHGSIQNRLGDRLKPVRTIVGAELNKILPTNQLSELTQKNRDDARAQFLRFAEILDKVK